MTFQARAIGAVQHSGSGSCAIVVEAVLSEPLVYKTLNLGVIITQRMMLLKSGLDAHIDLYSNWELLNEAFDALTPDEIDEALNDWQFT